MGDYSLQENATDQRTLFLIIKEMTRAIACLSSSQWYDLMKAKFDDAQGK